MANHSCHLTQGYGTLQEAMGWVDCRRPVCLLDGNLTVLPCSGVLQWYILAPCEVRSSEGPSVNPPVLDQRFNWNLAIDVPATSINHRWPPNINDWQYQHCLSAITTLNDNIHTTLSANYCSFTVNHSPLTAIAINSPGQFHSKTPASNSGRHHQQESLSIDYI